MKPERTLHIWDLIQVYNQYIYKNHPQVVEAFSTFNDNKETQDEIADYCFNLSNSVVEIWVWKWWFTQAALNKLLEYEWIDFSSWVLEQIRNKFWNQIKLTQLNVTEDFSPITKPSVVVIQEVIDDLPFLYFWLNTFGELMVPIVSEEMLNSDWWFKNKRIDKHIIWNNLEDLLLFMDNRFQPFKNFMFRYQSKNIKNFYSRYSDIINNSLIKNITEQINNKKFELSMWFLKKPTIFSLPVWSYKMLKNISEKQAIWDNIYILDYFEKDISEQKWTLPFYDWNWPITTFTYKEWIEIYLISIWYKQIMHKVVPILKERWWPIYYHHMHFKKIK